MARFSKTRNLGGLSTGSGRRMTVASGTAISAAIDARNALYGSLVTPAALTATTVIGFKVAEVETDTFAPAYDSSNALITVTAAVNESRGYAIPAAILSHAFFKIWTQAAGVDVNQASDRVFVVNLK